MQRHELDIRDRLQQRYAGAASAITTNSIRTFFTPLAEGLMNSRHGVLAKVMPVTTCTGAARLAERRFLAERFHVERIVTTHDPRRIAFSENTAIHECLLICGRHPTKDQPPTEFVSLRRMPENAEEAIEAIGSDAPQHRQRQTYRSVDRATFVRLVGAGRCRGRRPRQGTGRVVELHASAATAAQSSGHDAHVRDTAVESGLTRQGFCERSDSVPEPLANVAMALPESASGGAKQPRRPRSGGPRPRHEVRQMMARLERAAGLGPR